jgi:hypothetical protein
MLCDDDNFEFVPGVAPPELPLNADVSEMFSDIASIPRADDNLLSYVVPETEPAFLYAIVFNDVLDLPIKALPVDKS